MSDWDPKLKGSKYKKIRNIKNGFYKRHGVHVKNAKDVPKEKLHKVLDRWIKKRSFTESIDESYYQNIINSGFKGIKHAKVLYVDGEPAAINAGWKIPNSKNYYSAVGILDYSHEGLGEIANIDDLTRLKKEGYNFVDFGGSDKVLLRFKRKFKPSSSLNFSYPTGNLNSLRFFDLTSFLTITFGISFEVRYPARYKS